SSQHPLGETRGVSRPVAAGGSRWREVHSHRGGLRISRLAGEMAAAGRWLPPGAGGPATGAIGRQDRPARRERLERTAVGQSRASAPWRSSPRDTNRACAGRGGTSGPASDPTAGTARVEANAIAEPDSQDPAAS